MKDFIEDLASFIIAFESSPIWREVQYWSADDRYAWEDRVGIMMEGAGLSLDQAEHAAYDDCRLYRAGGTHHGK